MLVETSRLRSVRGISCVVSTERHTGASAMGKVFIELPSKESDRRRRHAANSFGRCTAHGTHR